MAAMCWFVKYSIIVIYVAGEASAAEKKEPAATLERVKRQVYWLRLTYDQRLAFARKHNEYRKDVDPRATDMKFLEWSYDLERSAQYEAKACSGRRSAFKGGENIAAIKDLNQDPASAVDTWYNENAYYTYKFNNCTEGKECGKYKQMVWAKSSQIGCGVKNCTTTRRSFIQVYCQYDRGYEPAKRPYEEGTVPNCPARTFYSGYESMCVRNNKCFGVTCDEGMEPDKYCICKPEETVASTVEMESTTEAVTEADCGNKTCDNGEVLDENSDCGNKTCANGEVLDKSCRCYCLNGDNCVTKDNKINETADCGNKTCANGEVLDKNCKCYCPNGDNCVTKDDKRNETVDCANKTCGNGEVLDEKCRCYCPDGATCGTIDDKRNGTVDCGSKNCINGEVLDENCKCYCPDGATCGTKDDERNGAGDCGEKTCVNGEVLDENCQCYCPDDDNCATKDDKRNGAVDVELPAAFVYVAVCVLAIFG